MIRDLPNIKHSRSLIKSSLISKIQLFRGTQLVSIKGSSRLICSFQKIAHAKQKKGKEQSHGIEIFKLMILILK